MQHPSKPHPHFISIRGHVLILILNVTNGNCNASLFHPIRVHNPIPPPAVVGSQSHPNPRPCPILTLSLTHPIHVPNPSPPPLTPTLRPVPAPRHPTPPCRLDPDVQLGTLSPAHVELLDSTWPYGGNVWSRRYLGELLRRFPHLCLQDPAGNLLGWVLSDGFAAGAHGYTVPAQRRRGLMRALTIMAARRAHGRGFPVYGHTATDNRAMQRLLEELGHRRLPGLCYFVLYNPALARAAPGAPPGSNA